MKNLLRLLKKKWLWPRVYMSVFKNLVVLLLLIVGTSAFGQTLKAGISIDKVPNAFYGTWRVVAKIDKQSGNRINFRPRTVEVWNLSRQGDVINLSNPFTGADASVTVDYVDGNIIRFTKKGNYDNKTLTDTVDLKLDGNTFTGINSLVFETFSTYDNSLIQKDTALYILKGEKISGTSITRK